MDVLSLIIPLLGSAGLGSALKIVSGFFDSRANFREIREKRKALEAMENRKADLEFQKMFFGNTEGAASARLTRRMVALICTGTFAWLMVWGSIHPDLQLTTFALPENKDGSSFLWGLYSSPGKAPITTTITLGHIVILGMNQLAVVLSFYFTPGGRK